MWSRDTGKVTNKETVTTRRKDREEGERHGQLCSATVVESWQNTKDMVETQRARNSGWKYKQRSNDNR